MHLFMPGYVDKALQQFQHAKPQAPQHAPFPSVPIKHGTRNNTPKYLLSHLLWTSKAKNSSCKSVVNYFSLARLTLHSSAQSVPSLHNPLNPLGR
ncbi:hypothetical protein ACHAW6_006313 [Cyclotella cf. meneghiniana]